MSRDDRGASSFDELASGLASGTLSRGRALRLMGAALIGGTLASLGIGEAAAAPIGCKGDGKKCKNDTQCCSGKCGEDHKCTACTANGGDCIVDSDCCTNICDQENGGTCASCRSNGNSCSGDSECCGGGVCKGPTGSGQCAAACIPPEATTCDPTASSPCSNSLCSCTRELSGQGYCTSFLGATISCTRSCECPRGMFCADTGSGGACAQVCT